MEVINYTYSAPVKKFDFQFDFDFSGFFKDFSGKLVVAIKKLYGLRRHAWVIPAAALIAATPFAVVSLTSYTESFAKRISLTADSGFKDDLLDTALTDFAVSDVSYFDNDGNVLTAGNSDNISVSLNFKDAVTFTNYTVKNGDTISGISAKFGLSNISTIIAVNNISNVRTLTSGTKLRIPSCDGLIHKVTDGQSISSVASKYKIPAEDIMDANDLSSNVLYAGQNLFIPGARLDSLSLRKAMGEIFTCPISARYRISSKFGPRKDPISGVASSHSGVDFACPTGTSIHASKSGKVSYTGFSSVWGNYVIINHGDGYQTLYAHMSKITAVKGQTVNQSSVIGLVGSTGYSTGPHLHFTVYKNGKLVDPLTIIK